MSWPAPQAHQILEEFWATNSPRCPDDNGPLKLKLHKLACGDYELLARCLVCGQSKEFRRGDDPRRSRFRSWTALEVGQLKQLARQNLPALCPVCDTCVEQQLNHSVSTSALVRCVRCGNSSQWMQA